MATPSAPPSIDRAIIPAAGLGTRLRPLTAAIPKEMLPLGRKPVLEYVVDELKSAGVKRILFVISPSKEMIRGYFGDGTAWGLTCDYVIQREMKGLGDAILHGADWIEGQPAIVAFGDCVIESSVESRELSGRYRPTRRMMQAHVANGCTATVLTETILRENSRKYGVVAPAEEIGETATESFPCSDIVEKPTPESAPSTWAVAARWVLEPEIVERLRCARPGADGEVNLTDSVRAAVREGGVLWSVPLLTGERRRDIGAWDTYLSASAEYALNDLEVGERVRAAVCQGSER
jgi:UTP--glucose-1-phosphate uridylyltransferase